MDDWLRPCPSDDGFGLLPRLEDLRRKRFWSFPLVLASETMRAAARQEEQHRQATLAWSTFSHGFVPRTAERRTGGTELRGSYEFAVSPAMLWIGCSPPANSDREWFAPDPARIGPIHQRLLRA